MRIDVAMLIGFVDTGSIQQLAVVSQLLGRAQQCMPSLA